MKFDIKDRKKNPLMKREEAVVSIEHAGKATPNRVLVLSEIAKLVKSKPENIVIDRIITHGGSTVSEVKVFSYSKKDDIPEWRLKKMAQRASKIKGKPKEEPKPEGEATQEPTGEKPGQEEPKPVEPAKEEPAEEKPAEEPRKESQKGENPTEAPAENAEKQESQEEGKDKKEGI